MKIQRLELSNFRGIRELEFDFDESMNVIVGVNGSGKSSILDCAAIMLSRLIAKVRATHGIGRMFSDLDIANNTDFTGCTINVVVDKSPIRWTVVKTQSRYKALALGMETNQKELVGAVEVIHASLAANAEASVPLAVYYPVARAVLDIPLRIRTKHGFDQLSAYDEALSGASSDFRLFFEWFRNREDLENEERLRSGHHRLFDDDDVVRPKLTNGFDWQLTAVRQAIEAFLPGVKGLRIQRSPLRMVLEKGDQLLSVNQLSDGEKCLMALVGDLARRLSIANPGLEKPREGVAIVLIDEIDLHLHPAWQRSIIPNLRNAFPNCQFILTTHSPQVLSHVPSNQIAILKSVEGNVTLNRTDDAFGRDSNRILEDIMDVDSRPPEFKQELAKLFKAIDDGKLEQARKLAKRIESEIGADPELTKAGVLIRRKEILKP